MRSLAFIALGWLPPIVVLLLATPVLVAHLGFGGFGVFALGGALVVAGAALDLGIGTLAVRQLASSRGEDALFRRRAAAVNTAFLGLAALGAGVTWLWAGAIAQALQWDRELPPGEAVAAVRWTGVWLGFAYLNMAQAHCLRAVERFDLVVSLSSGAMMAVWIAAAVGSRLGLGAADVLALAAGVTAVQLTLSCVACRRVFGRWPRVGRWQGFEAGAARFAGGAFVGQATSLATYHADKAIISALLGAAPAGMYAAAANVANKPLAFIAALAGLLLPRVAALERAGRGFRSARTYLAASRMLVAASTLMLVVGWVLAADFIAVWLGPAVPDAVTLCLRLLLLAYWIATLSVAPSSTLAGQGNTHRGAMFALAGGVVTVLACWMLVPRFGIVGAAVAALFGMSQAAVFELWAHREAQARVGLARFRLRRTAVALAAGACGAAVAAAIVQAALPAGWAELFAAASAASIAFAALWFGLGLAVREERMLLGRAIRWLRRRRR
jgi:O-antigen/teichoic acid export membrane protein